MFKKCLNSKRKAKRSPGKEGAPSSVCRPSRQNQLGHALQQRSRSWRGPGRYACGSAPLISLARDASKSVMAKDN